MAVLATILAAVGALTASLGSQACIVVILDEAECPKSLIK